MTWWRCSTTCACDFGDGATRCVAAVGGGVWVCSCCGVVSSVRLVAVFV